MSDNVERFVQPGSIDDLVSDLASIAPEIDTMVVSIRYKDGTGDLKWTYIDFGDACVHDVQWRHAFIQSFREMAGMTDD
jgi:hypothetical protein